MKKILQYLALIILTVIASCKKEMPCEGCATKNNKPPIAIAGPDQVITLPTDSVSLDGRTSSDPDGMISSYLWTKISGPSFFTIIKPSDSITKVKTLVAGNYQFELKVTDNGGLSSKDTVQVIVNDPSIPNRPPVANAGGDQTITLPTNTVNLDGSASTDPENNITGYVWTKISGPTSFNIVNLNAVQTQVTNLIQGIYQLELKVTDAGGLFSKDTIQVTSQSVVPPPSLSCNISNRPIIQAQLIPLGTLSQSRFSFAIAGAGNKLVFAGGWINNGNSSPSSTRVDIYDIASGSWTIAQLSEGRFGIGVAVLGNKIFFAGGGMQQDNGWGAWQYGSLGSSVVDIFDVANNSWSTAQLSSPRAPVGASAGNKIVFAGGDDGHPSSQVDVYDGISNTWTSRSLSEAKHISQIAVSGNKIFLAGGSGGLFGSGGNGISKQIDILDASTGGWAVDFLSLERGEMGAIGANNRIYWGGGAIVSTQNSEYDITNSVEIRDLATNTTSFDCLSEARVGSSAVRKDNKIIFFGGGVNSSTFDIYDLATNSWSIGVLPQNLLWPSIISYNNILYVAGGEINGIVSNQVFKLEF